MTEELGAQQMTLSYFTATVEAVPKPRLEAQREQDYVTGAQGPIWEETQWPRRHTYYQRGYSEKASPSLPFCSSNISNE